ncbi:MAG: hypothetical protein DWQ29_16215, partial [Planctomycetota bacterium]
PQDPISAINGNPATLSQMKGTNFTFGGAWADATMNFDQTAAFPVAAPVVTPFSAESDYPGSVLANIGVTQELDLAGMPATFGMALVSNAGAGVDLVDTPESNGTASSMLILETVSGVGVELTDSLSAGASFQFGTGFLDSPFVGAGKMTPDYGVRGSFGVDYDLGRSTTVGAYYQTKQHFTFDRAVVLNLGGGAFSAPLDVKMDLPRTVGVGVANTSLMDGNLLLAVDVLWKNWEDADLFQAIYEDQWVLQLGAQYTAGSTKFRIGYAWAENPVANPPAAVAGGVAPPGAVAAVQYLQSQLAVINQHRLSGGVGFANVMPGIDMDLFAGGMFKDSQRLGATTVEIQSYWIGFGLTWHFDGAGRATL